MWFVAYSDIGEFGTEVDVEMLSAMEVLEVLAGHLRDGNVGDVDFVFPDEIEQEVERTLEAGQGNVQGGAHPPRHNGAERKGNQWSSPIVRRSGRGGPESSMAMRSAAFPGRSTECRRGMHPLVDRRL